MALDDMAVFIENLGVYVEAYHDENARLKKRVKELEKALAFSRLETEARDLMITRAEEYFNIPIRKKHGAK